jgi:hypothetical protein
LLSLASGSGNSNKTRRLLHSNTIMARPGPVMKAVLVAP